MFCKDLSGVVYVLFLHQVMPELTVSYCVYAFPLVKLHSKAIYKGCTHNMLHMNIVNYLMMMKLRYS